MRKSKPFFIKDTSIFSPLEDAVIFTIPVIIGIILLVYLNQFPIDQRMTINRPIDANFILFLDNPHVFSTLGRVYFSKPEKQWPKFIKIFPILFYFFTVVLTQYSKVLFFKIMVYAVMFHHIRQQYGWMMYSIRREPNLSPLDRNLDKIAIYCITLLPVIWYHSYFAKEGWTRPFDIFQLPTAVGDFANYVHWAFLGFYFLRQVFLFWKTRNINGTKLLIFFTSWIGWYWLTLYAENLPRLYTLFLMHYIPYLYLMYYWYKKKSSKKGNSIQKALIFYTSSVFFYFVIRQIKPELKSFPFITILISAIPLSLALSHYLFDAIIWRTQSKKNPDLLRIFRFS